MYNRLFCYKIRTYRITTPSAYGGKACPRPLTETGTCTIDCSVNCIGVWSDWKNICHNYKIDRTRTYTIITQAANGGKACPSPLTETVILDDCNFDTIGVGGFRFSW